MHRLLLARVEGKDRAFQMGLFTHSPRQAFYKPLLHNFCSLGSWLGWRAK